MAPTGTGGGQHHQASALIAREAFKLAGDPTKYPEQLKDGLRPWAPKKFYFNQGVTGFGPAGSQPDAGKMLRVNLSVYDPLLGKTYAEIGTEARSMHKCQGMAQLLALPGPSASTYQLAESTIPGQMQKDETSLFDGVDSTIPGLAQFAGPRPPQDLVSGLAAIASAVQDAQKKFDSGPHEATLPPLLAGLHAVRALRGQLRGMTLDDNGRYDIDMRLAQKESRVSAGDSPGERRARRSAGRRRAGGAGTAGEGLGAGGEQRRLRRHRQAGEVQRLRRRRAVRADAR